jgi:hypothetical protein
VFLFSLFASLQFACREPPACKKNEKKSSEMTKEGKPLLSLSQQKKKKPRGE